MRDLRLLITGLILVLLLTLIGCTVQRDAVYLDPQGNNHLLVCQEEMQPNGRYVLQCHKDSRAVW
jgi:hypothetical protein